MLAHEGTGLVARIYCKSIKLGWYWMDGESLMRCFADGQRWDGALRGVQSFSRAPKPEAKMVSG